MIAAMLQATGYKTGLYTSPHLVDIRERMQIDGHMIPQAEFARLVKLIEPVMRPSRTFNAALAIGFASSIRREWAWRVKRGESLANLQAFAPFARPAT